MIELHVDYLSHEAGREKQWYRNGTRIERFSSLKAAKDFCRDNYGKGHKSMYRDTKEGTQRVGRVYHTKELEKGKVFYCQYWVSAYVVTPILFN